MTSDAEVEFAELPGAVKDAAVDTAIEEAEAAYCPIPYLPT